MDWGDEDIFQYKNFQFTFIWLYGGSEFHPKSSIPTSWVVLKLVVTEIAIPQSTTRCSKIDQISIDLYVKMSNFAAEINIITTLVQ